MIILKDIQKSYPSRFGSQVVLKDINLTLPDDRDIALVGSNGSGKSTLLRLIGGLEQPTSGRVISDRLISWPVGFAGGFNAKMTGRENARFVARIHGIRQTVPIEESVKEFCEIGDSFELPFGRYSAGMRSRFSFAMSMAFDFDTILLDEVMSVGDPQFRKKCKEMIEAKRETSNIILVSHDVETLRDHCNAAILLAYGRAEFYETLDQAIFRYKYL